MDLDKILRKFAFARLNMSLIVTVVDEYQRAENSTPAHGWEWY